MGRFFRTVLCGLLIMTLFGLASVAEADPESMTRVLVSLDRLDAATVMIDMDLTVLLGDPARYYALAIGKGPQHEAEVQQVADLITRVLPFFAGSKPLHLSFVKYSFSQKSQAEYMDLAADKPAHFQFDVALPPEGGALQLRIPLGAQIDYPVAYTLQLPERHFTQTRWMDAGQHESLSFEYRGKLPTHHADQPASFDPDTLAWWQQLPIYLKLGFKHIVPEGTDHILFVLGLFFLGISWRKLLSQTTVFTVAHATTLFLSTYGIFELPSRFVEPAIALSISFVGLENVFSPRLGVMRLLVVFAFGLIHGFGFASSLSEVPFPKRDFIGALLGFNLGVDAGQLFIILLATLAVGWFRKRPWFRSRIAIPGSLVIAAIGLFWAGQRILAYHLFL
ncbi:HupE/UreJ family protein [Gluconobacter japonicus]|uniref:HupE/UreJ family protein n=1 Tax=Gluconobacter japonicus TaxID=376620 RepID=UPI0024AE490D|nr:HupE/UreJ family protein [Gluconobacter japonicus]